jgi:hypothetical protein
MIETLAALTAGVVRELAASQGVCIRPILRRVHDRETDTETTVPIPCGSTREAVCPACAQKARVLRMRQCAEGWHRTAEPASSDAHEPTDGDHEDQADDDRDGAAADDRGLRRVRSTRRRQDVPGLPRVPAEDRTLGQVFTSPDGKQYRPSMFLTVTLPSYGPVTPSGAPRDPGSYDYRRQALDALHFSKLVDRLWQNLRRCAGYRVQYFAAVEPQHRLALHLHAAIRGAVPRAILRQVVRATYEQVWWPAFDTPLYVDRLPVWDSGDYIDPDAGEVLATWQEALDRLETGRDAQPAHVLRFGSQLDMAGIIAPSEDADRAVRYLAKYLTKSIADTYTDEDGPDPAYQRHVARLHAELRFLPCSPRCANWLRYGIQPDQAGPGLEPGYCDGPAHTRENLGLGGRRVLVSQQWSGKTLAEHKADRATVVREALLAAGIVAPEVERMAATATLPDGSPRYVWTETEPEPGSYVRVLLASVAERLRWRAQYEQAKADVGAVDNSFGNSAAQPP